MTTSVAQPEAAAASAALRRTMVECQLRTFDVTDIAVLESINATPREPFLAGQSAAVRALAYSDSTLDIVGGATRRSLLAPMALGRLVQAAGVKSTDRVLDVGGGTGYSAVVLAGLAHDVTALESDPAFVAEVVSITEDMLGVDNVRPVLGALEEGCAQHGPYDVILINGAIEVEPTALLAQLADGGRLLAIRREGDQSGRAGHAVRYEKHGGGVGVVELFDAGAATLAGFAASRGFSF